MVFQIYWTNQPLPLINISVVNRDWVHFQLDLWFIGIATLQKTAKDVAALKEDLVQRFFEITQLLFLRPYIPDKTQAFI